MKMSPARLRTGQKNAATMRVFSATKFAGLSIWWMAVVAAA
jgi:hypothetical protein